MTGFPTDRSYAQARDAADPLAPFRERFVHAAGQPLIYRLEGDGYLLYSVGVNGIDDGGQGYDDDPKGDDLVIRWPVPDPKLTK